MKELYEQEEPIELMHDDPGSDAADLEGHLTHISAGIAFGLCIFMTMFSMATFLWYQAYRNLSSMTLIGL